MHVRVSYCFRCFQPLDLPPDPTCSRTKPSLFLCMNCRWFNAVQFQCPSHFLRKWKSAAGIRVICHMRRPFRKVLSCKYHLFLSISQLTVLQIDFSKELIAWVKNEGFSLLDANLFPKPAVVPLTVSSHSF